MIPSTSSISLTLENMYTDTKLSFLPKDATSDVMYIGDELQGEKETTKASKVLDIFRTESKSACQNRNMEQYANSSRPIIKFLRPFSFGQGR